MTDAIIRFFENTLQNDILTIIFIAVVPIIELRGSIPVGVAMGMPLWEAYIWAWVGSSLVCPILLLILRPVLDWMKKTKWFRSLALAVEGTFRSRAEKVVKESERSDPKKEKKKMIGVYAFVAVPLPLTGVWTGSAIAAFLDMPFWKALVSVLLGNLTAGGIVTLLTYFFKDYVDIILTVFFVIVLVVLVFYIVMVAGKIAKNKKLEKAQTQTVGADCSAESENDTVVIDASTDEDARKTGEKEYSEKDADPPEVVATPDKEQRDKDNSV